MLRSVHFSSNHTQIHRQQLQKNQHTSRQKLPNPNRTHETTRGARDRTTHRQQILATETQLTFESTNSSKQQKSRRLLPKIQEKKNKTNRGIRNELTIKILNPN